ncbi:MAG: DUF6172 family protein [Gammaproteobacteria bacterium]|nr:DUF6172 family protein [Gammaproteobacteria bacterium]
MKKTFKLSHDRIKPERLVEAIKHEVKKYIKRERKRKLPAGVDFLDFDCRFGAEEISSDVIHLSEINKSIDWAVSKELDSFYLEIIAKPGHRTPKPAETEQDH